MSQFAQLDQVHQSILPPDQGAKPGQDRETIAPGNNQSQAPRYNPTIPQQQFQPQQHFQHPLPQHQFQPLPQQQFYPQQHHQPLPQQQQFQPQQQHHQPLPQQQFQPQQQHHQPLPQQQFQPQQQHHQPLPQQQFQPQQQQQHRQPLPQQQQPQHHPQANQFQDYSKKVKQEFTMNPNNFKGNNGYNLNRTSVPKELRSPARGNIDNIAGFDAQGGTVTKNQEQVGGYAPYEPGYHSQFSDNYELIGNPNNGVHRFDTVSPQKLQPQPPIQGDQTRLSLKDEQQMGKQIGEHQFQNQDLLNNKPYVPTYLEYKPQNPNQGVVPLNQENLQRHNQMNNQGQSSNPYQQQQMQQPRQMYPQQQVPPQMGIHSNNINYQDQFQNQGHPNDFRNPYMTHQNNQLNQMRGQKQAMMAPNQVLIHNPNQPQQIPDDVQSFNGSGVGTGLSEAFAPPSTQDTFGQQFSRTQV